MSACYMNYTQQSMEAIIESPGETASTLRRAVQEQAAQCSSHATPFLGQLPQEVHAYFGPPGGSRTWTVGLEYW
ncbi:MAG TPA: hypothetical protein VKY19_23235 [Ktedonosporobacter sp.]|jgi:hypothetical protein|nr:hypothetical protein [Ktedonosporobacter sp.]